MSNNSQNRYRSELERLINRLDLSKKVAGEVISTFDSLIDELDLSANLTLSDLEQELGSPKEFVSDYLEMRYTTKEIFQTDDNSRMIFEQGENPLQKRVRSVFNQISTWPSPSSQVKVVLAVIGVLTYAFVSAFFLSYFSGVSLPTWNDILRLFALHLVIFTMIVTLLVSYNQENKRLFSLLLGLELLVLMVAVAIELFDGRFTLGLIGLVLYTTFMVLVVSTFAILAVTLVIFVFPNFVFYRVILYSETTAWLLMVGVTILWFTLIYQTLRLISPRVIAKIDQIYPLSDIEIQDESGTTRVIPYKNPVNYIHHLIEKRNSDTKSPYLVTSILQRLRVRSLTAAKFAPQFDRRMTAIYFLVAAITGLSIITQIIGLTMSSIIIIYIIYELFSGITGVHLSSRNLSLMFRKITRIGLFIATILTYFMDLVGIIEPDLGNSMLIWLFMLVYLETTIFLREYLPGLIPLEAQPQAYSVDGLVKTTGIGLLVTVLVAINLNLEAWSASLLFLIFLLLLQTLPILFDIDIKGTVYPTLSFVTLLGLYHMVYENANYHINVGTVIPAVVYWIVLLIVVVTCSIAFYNYLEELASISFYQSDQKEDTLVTEERFFDLIENLELRIVSLMDRYRIKLSYLLVIVVTFFAFLSVNLAEDRISAGSVIEGPAREYYILPGFYPVFVLFLFLLLLLVLLFLVEFRQDVSESTSPLISVNSLKQFLHIKKLFLIFLILITLSNLYVTTVEESIYQFSNRHLGSDPKYLIHGDIQVEMVTFDQDGINTSDNTYKQELIGFIESTNVNYNLYLGDQMRSYLPIVSFEVTLSLDHWLPEFRLFIINETLYRQQVESWDSDTEPFDFEDKFYFSQQFVYEDVVEQNQNEVLRMFDGATTLEINTSQVSYLDRNPGLKPQWGEVESIYTTFDTFATLNFPLTESVPIEGSLRNLRVEILVDHERPASDFYTDSEESEEQLDIDILAIEDHFRSVMEVDENTQGLEIYAYRIYQPTLDNSFRSPEESESYWILLVIFTCLITLVLSVLFRFDVLQSQLLMTRAKKLGAMILGTTCLALGIVFGILLGMISSEFVFEARIPVISPHYDFRPIVALGLVQIMMFILINLPSVFLKRDSPAKD